MKTKKLSYESDDIKITYDLKRCIHARECVNGLRDVFDAGKRPWVQPDEAQADEIADVIERCPTGALHYERKDGGPEEDVPDVNSIIVIPDGPVYLRGDIEIQDPEGNTLLQDTRVSICRCGASANKPLCDNTHLDIEFEAGASFDPSPVLQEPPGENEKDKLIIKAMENGPLIVSSGNYQIYSETSPPIGSSKNIALCRCGGSSNKPYCDGTHKEIGFESS